MNGSSKSTPLIWPGSLKDRFGQLKLAESSMTRELIAFMNILKPLSGKETFLDRISISARACICNCTAGTDFCEAIGMYSMRLVENVCALLPQASLGPALSEPTTRNRRMRMRMKRL